MIKQYILDLMNDKRSDPVSQAVKFFLLVLSIAYGFLTRAHNFFYRINLLKRYKMPVTTVSVGNITLGGTGKTPFTIMLAQTLGKMNKKTAVLIRGYGEDEWKMLEDKLGKIGVAVFVGRDRVKSAREAVSRGAEAIILDDGFQHRRLKRDLDIALVDSGSPFGNGRLLPRGVLRETPASLGRSDIIILTKVDRSKSGAVATEAEIKKIAPGKKILKAAHRPENLINLGNNGREECSLIAGRRVCAVSAICDPSYFRFTLEKTGAVIGAEFVFPDHYLYRKSDLKRIYEECEKNNIDFIITTEKDAVKLKNLAFPGPALSIFALRINLEITEGEEELDVRLNRLHMRPLHQGA